MRDRVEASVAHSHLVMACAELHHAAAAAQAAGLTKVQVGCQALRERAAKCGRDVMAAVEADRDGSYD